MSKHRFVYRRGGYFWPLPWMERDGGGEVLVGPYPNLEEAWQAIERTVGGINRQTMSYWRSTLGRAVTLEVGSLVTAPDRPRPRQEA